MAAGLSLCTNPVAHGLGSCDQMVGSSFLNKFSKPLFRVKQKNRGLSNHQHRGHRGQVLRVMAVTESSAKSKETDDKIPSWARPDSNEPPPWASEEGKAESSLQNLEIPFYVYLLASTVTAIAAVGSIFEYMNQRPVFGLINPDSAIYAPLLGFFVFTGVPTSAFLWFKSVQAANKEAEEQDRRDGFL